MRLTLAGAVALGLATTVLILGADKLGWLRERPLPAPRPAAAPSPAPAVAARTTTPVPPPRETGERPEDLPEGEARELVFYTCTACHGFAIVRQQGQSAPQWDATIDFMIERHKMVPPAAEVRTAIVAYLARTFPPRRRAPVNPFLR